MPPPLPWEPGGRPPGKPPPLPWEEGGKSPPPLPNEPGGWQRISHHPGYHVHGSPFGLVQDTGEVGWIPVGSSNVEAIKWVETDQYPLKVKFLAKDNYPSRTYEYRVPLEVLDDMFSAGSMGRFVWQVLRGQGYPYREIT